MEYALLNISHNDYPDAPDGILPNYKRITDYDGNILTSDGSKTGEKTPFVCFDAGGGKTKGDGALSSILVVYFDTFNGVSLLYPHGSKSIGIQYEAPKGFERHEDANGKLFMYDTARVLATVGISINNSLACTRIANVDPTDETSLKLAMNYLFDAYDRMTPTMKTGVRIFTTRPVVSAMRKMQYNHIYQTSLAGVQALNLKGDVVVDGDVFTVCHNMLSTEGRIKASDEN